MIRVVCPPPKRMNNLLISECDSTKGSFYPTPSDCEKWYQRLNENVFGNVLPFSSEFDIRRRRKVWALFRFAPTVLYKMNRKYRSKRQFVEVLAHEMVHHWQLLEGHNIAHGPSFYSWVVTFKENGMTLTRIVK